MQHQKQVESGQQESNSDNENQVNGTGCPDKVENQDGPTSHSQNGFIDRDVGEVINMKLCRMDKEIIRVIGQCLLDLGCKKTVDMLMAETGLRLDHPSAARFRQCVMDGDWAKAESYLCELQSFLEDPSNITEMRFLLLEQKYLELLESGNDIEALTCLRSQITPLGHKEEQVHHLSSLMCISDVDELRTAANWKGAGKESRQKLMDKLGIFFPPTIILPPNRLKTLVFQAVEHQKSECLFHNTAKSFSSGDSLLVDHVCPVESFPSVTVQKLTDHCDEVLIAKFSPDGTKLATGSGSRDSTVIIWDVDVENYHITRKLSLDGHSFGIGYVAWSPDSTKLITCLKDDAAELLVWDADTGQQICKVSNSREDSLTCAAWHKDSNKFICGGMKGQFYLCDLEGQILETWEGVRVQCLAYHKDGKTVLAADSHNRVRGYLLEEVQDYNIIQEDHGIMTFSLDDTGRYVLLNIVSQGVHMWDLQDRSLVRKYRGISQKECAIYSCFGGHNQDFIASGSEDSKVYIWHRRRELPIKVLSGHAHTVNCVTWNPIQPGMLASASDDTTVRIWGPAPEYRNNKTTSQNNGCDSTSLENGCSLFLSNGTSD